LGCGQGQLPGTDGSVGGVLDLVFLVRAGVGLGPQIERVPWCATDLKRDEMILLVVRRVGVGVPVPHDLGLLQR
jgi:hypothetical protein